MCVCVFVEYVLCVVCCVLCVVRECVCPFLRFQQQFCLGAVSELRDDDKVESRREQKKVH